MSVSAISPRSVSTVAPAIGVGEPDRVTTPRTTRAGSATALPHSITSARAAGREALLLDGDLDHLDRRLRPIARVRLRGLDLLHDVHAGDDLAEHRVLRRSGAEPVEAIVVHGVDEELRATR